MAVHRSLGRVGGLRSFCLGAWGHEVVLLAFKQAGRVATIGCTEVQIQIGQRHRKPPSAADQQSACECRACRGGGRGPLLRQAALRGTRPCTNCASCKHRRIAVTVLNRKLESWRWHYRGQRVDQVSAPDAQAWPWPSERHTLLRLRDCTSHRVPVHPSFATHNRSPVL